VAWKPNRGKPVNGAASTIAALGVSPAVNGGQTVRGKPLKGANLFSFPPFLFFLFFFFFILPVWFFFLASSFVFFFFFVV